MRTPEQADKQTYPCKPANKHVYPLPLYSDCEEENGSRSY